MIGKIPKSQISFPFFNVCPIPIQNNLEQSGSAEIQIAQDGTIIGWAVDESVKNLFTDDDPTGKNITETMSKDEAEVFIYCIKRTLITGLDSYISHKFKSKNGEGFRQVRIRKPQKSTNNVVDAYVTVI